MPSYAKCCRQFAAIALTGLASLFAPASVAVECGANGGDNRAEQTANPLDCHQNGEPANHPGSSPGSATQHSIDLITGNKYLRHVDADWPGGLVFARHYNSLNAFQQSLGPGWSHSFDTALAIVLRPKTDQRAPHREAQIIQADGRRIAFASDGVGPHHQLFKALDPSYGAIRQRDQMPKDRRFLWRWRDGSRLYFSASGRLTALEANNGVRLTLHYDQNGSRLKKVSNRHGVSYQFQYPGTSARLARIEQPDGQVIAFRYDPMGVLTHVTKTNQTQWQYDYADEHLTAIVQVRGVDEQLVGRYRYNAQGRAIYSAPADASQAVSINYRVPLKQHGTGQTTVTDDNGRQSTYHWRFKHKSQQRELLRATGAGCTACPPTGITRQYDPLGRLVASHKASGRSKHWRYDTAGRLDRIEWKTRDDNGQTTTDWREYVYADPTFDAVIIRIDRPSVAPNKRRQTWLFRDSLERLTDIVDTGYQPIDMQRLLPNSSQANHQSPRPRWRFISKRRHIEYARQGAAQGLVAKLVLPGQAPSQAISYSYDNKGRLSQTEQAGRPTKTREYDAFGRVIKQRTRNGKNWAYQYGKDGLVRKISSERYWREYQRDKRRRLTRISSSNRPAINFSYADNGRLNRVYDDHGNWLSSTPVADKKTSASTALPGANSSKKAADESNINIVAINRLTSHQDGALLTTRKPSTGEFTRALVDDFGQTVALADPYVGISRRFYDLDGKLQIFANSDHSIRLLRYDQANQLVGIVSGAGKVFTRTIKHTNAGHETESRDRVQTKRVSIDHAAGKRTTTLSYTNPNRPNQTTPTIQFSEQLDTRGRLAAQIFPGQHTLRYQWTTDNQLSGITFSTDAGDTVSLVRDLQWLPFTGGNQGLISAHFGNGTHLRIERDAQLRTNRVRHVAPLLGTAPLPDITLFRNAAGKIIRKRTNNVDDRFEYDHQGRLTEVDTAIQRSQYQHSRTGNRTGTSRKNKQLHHHTAAEPTTRTSTKPRWFSDNAGRVRWARGRNNHLWHYLFNASGERVAKINLSQPRQSHWFVYDRQRLSMRLNADGSLDTIYLRLDDKPFAMIRMEQGKASIYWIHTDHRGLPLAVTDKQGQVRWQAQFDPFGNRLQSPVPTGIDSDYMKVGFTANSVQPVKDENAAFMPIRLPGQYYDHETGLHDNYLRTYNPRTGQYLGPDPLGLRANGSRFAYANASPLDTIDPLGLYEVDIHFYMTYFLALAAGVPAETARVIANANQGIDNNPLTQPINEDEDGDSEYLRSIASNRERLLSYHFALTSQVDGNLTTQSSRDYENPTSTQLNRLQNSVQATSNPCAQAQLLGEYLHAYQDTFAHRTHDNTPIAATSLGLGLGHAIYLNDPDHTFNFDMRVPPRDPERYYAPRIPETPDGERRIVYENWEHNEARTLAMERETYQILAAYGDPGQAIPWSEIEALLSQFNATQEWEQDGLEDHESFPIKLALLEQLLNARGITNAGQEPIRFLDPRNRAAQDAYRQDDAVGARRRNLCIGSTSFRRDGVISQDCP